MDFDDTWRWAAFSPGLLAQADALRAQFGRPAYDGTRLVSDCLLCGWDDDAHARKRAMELGKTAAVVPLSDGRVCAGGLWSTALKQAWEAGAIVGVEELTQEQFDALRISNET